MKVLSRFCSKALLGAAVVAFGMGMTRADSLWSAELKISLVGDKKGNAVGDIITVVVQENNTTKKDSSTKTAKKTALDAGIDSFLFSPGASKFMTKGGALPAMKMASNNSFDGGGQIDNSASIVARFGVRVVDELPNGNLLVEGTRLTQFSGESQTIILRGTVRQEDITSNNTVFSYNLADVSIKFVDSGAVSNSQKKGWFGKVWDVLTPF